MISLAKSKWDTVAFVLCIWLTWVDDFFVVGNLFWQHLFNTVLLVLAAGLACKIQQHRQKRLEQLESFIRVCAWCNKVGMDDHTWVSFEEYINAEHKLKPSHGICPECYKTAVAEMDEPRQKDN